MAMKRKLIASAWVSTGGIGGLMVYRRVRDFEETAPCIQEAMHTVVASEDGRRVLGTGDMRLARWPRRTAVDQAAGRARASFELRGDTGSAYVVMSAKRQANAQEAWEDRQEDEEDVVKKSRWRYYLAKPWELKLALLGKFRSWRGVDSEVEDVKTGWYMDTLFFLPNGDAHNLVSLVGNPRALPEYETLYLRQDAAAKGETSRWRLKLLFGFALAGTIMAASWQMVRSLQVSRSYGFVKKSLLVHRDVAVALGQNLRVQSSSGIFGANYINGHLQLVSNAGVVAGVDITATRDGGAHPWRVLLARMRHAGMTYDLDKSQF